MVDAVRAKGPLLGPSLFVLAYYSGGAMRGSAMDQTRIWTIDMTEYVFMAGAMSIVGDKDGAC